MITSKQQHALILLSSVFSLVFLRAQQAFALCMEEPGNLLIYCRGAGSPSYHAPYWYNQPIAAVYFLALIGVFIGLMLALLFVIKYKKAQLKMNNQQDRI